MSWPRWERGGAGTVAFSTARRRRRIGSAEPRRPVRIADTMARHSVLRHCWFFVAVVCLGVALGLPSRAGAGRAFDERALGGDPWWIESELKVRSCARSRAPCTWQLMLLLFALDAGRAESLAWREQRMVPIRLALYQKPSISWSPGPIALL